jgi:hypothetical protein
MAKPDQARKRRAVDQLATVLCYRDARRKCKRMRKKIGMVLYMAASAILLLQLFPEFRKDMSQSWDMVSNGYGFSIDLPHMTPGDAIPYVIFLCAMGTGFLLYWHHKPN